MLLTAAATGIYTAIAPMRSMPSDVFAGAVAAAGLGLVNSLGNIGGLVAPFMVGVVNDATHNDQSGLLFLSTCLAVTGVAAYFYVRNCPVGDTRVDISSHAVPAPTNRNESK